MKKLISILIIPLCLVACINSSQVDVTANTGVVVADVSTTVVESTVVNSTVEVATEEVVVVEDTPKKEEVVVVNLGGIANKLPIDKYTSKYDAIIRKETKRCFGPVFDWRWLKSQVAAESAFNPNAVSPVGAKGLSQFMVPTFNDVVKRSGYVQDDIFNPRWNLAAQAWYDRRLYNTWSSKRTELSRIQLMMCSYNSGLRYPLKAQKLCIAAGMKSCNEWYDIRAFAHDVPSWISEESLGYVKKISKLMGHNDY